MLDLFNQIGEYVAAVTAIVAAASVLTAITPTKTDDKYVNYALSILNFLALNIFKNKNADSE